MWEGIFKISKYCQFLGTICVMELEFLDIGNLHVLL